VNGRSLSSIIDDKKLLKIHGVQIFRLLLDAVKYMAKKGYAHRNICPDNIYIASDFQSIQLINFNKACFRDRREKVMKGCQRPYWQPMDKWWSQSTFRWDLMQASIVFYECMETKAFFHFF
jgi:serine/threonine protein kinase